MTHTFDYFASMTREPFLFYEMRGTARLLLEGLTDKEIIAEVIRDNLYQYPTERSLKKVASCCLRRLHALGDRALIEILATYPVEEAKQVCLYAMMKQDRLVWEFMVSVIGAKNLAGERNFSKMDLNVFFMQLQEQNDTIAKWSDATIQKLKQVLLKTLVECDYLDSTKSEILNPIYLYPALENGIRSNGDDIVLPVFHCFA